MKDTVKIDGAKLKAARVDRFIERKELADRVGNTRRRIESLEAGAEGGSRLSTVRKLAEPLEVDPHELLLTEEGNGRSE